MATGQRETIHQGLPAYTLDDTAITPDANPHVATSRDQLAGRDHQVSEPVTYAVERETETP
jgi:hypothetical protein